MKVPQFRVRTLLLLTAIMGMLFVACAKWPVTETVFSLSTKSGGSVLFTTDIKRNPTFNEWAIRASIAAGIVLAVFVVIGAWRARNARSPAN